MKTSTLNTLFAALVIVLLAGCNNSRIERPDGDFQVEAIAPADGAEAVPADQSIRIRFNVAPAAGAVDATTITVTADDEPVTGKLLVDGNQVTFVPAQLRPDTAYRVTVSGALLGDNGGALGSDVTTTFETARLRRGQPNDFVDPDAQAPFKNQKFVYLTRQTEMVLLGFNYDGRGHNFYVVDPGDATAPDTIMHSEAAPRFSQDIRKVAAAGNLDRDAHDEVVMVLQENETAGKIHVLDGTNGDFDIRELEYTLSIPDTDGGAYRYELALGDVDGDGYDEIVVAAHHSSQTAYLWVIDDKRSGYTLLTEKVVPGLDGGAINDLHLAVADLDGDGNAEIALANARWTYTSTFWQVQDGPGYQMGGWVYFQYRGWSYDVSLLVVDSLDEDLTTKEQPVRRTGFEEHGWLFDVYSGDPIPFFGAPLTVTPRLRVELTAGDVDGDGTSELLLATRRSDFRNVAGSFFPAPEALLYVDSMADVSELSVDRLRDGALVAGTTVVRTEEKELNTEYSNDHFSVAADVDGDRKDEVLFDGEMHKWNGTELAATDNKVDLDPAQSPVLMVTRGDANGDGLTDVLVLRDNGSVSVYGNGRIKTHYDLHMQPQFTYSWSNLDTLRNDNTTRIGDSQVLVAANLDDDSLILEPRRINEAHADLRTVEHTTVFSADRIVAVLAAAPCHAETWQDSRRCRTALTRPTNADDNQMTGDASLIVTSGTMVSSEVSDASAFGLKEAAYQLAGYLADELTRNGRGRQSATTEARFGTAATGKDDLVVFYTVPYHRYTFTFASHPDPAVRGTRAYINLPLTPRVFSMTRTAYNVTHTGAAATTAATNAKLNDSLFPHVAGEPSTYLSADEAEELSVNTSETQSVRKDRHAARQSLGLWRQATADGIISLDAAGSSRLSCEGLRVGFSTDTSSAPDSEPIPAATASFSSDLDARGSVGALHESTWEDNHYNWGLFSYLATQTSTTSNSDTPTQQFLIISYYVD